MGYIGFKSSKKHENNIGCEISEHTSGPVFISRRKPNPLLLKLGLIKEKKEDAEPATHKYPKHIRKILRDNWVAPSLKMRPKSKIRITQKNRKKFKEKIKDMKSRLQSSISTESWAKMEGGIKQGLEQVYDRNKTSKND